MYIPKTFKDTIANTFYDKEIKILNSTIIYDAEGGATIKGGDVSTIFKGNVNFTNLKSIQEEYGLDYQIDVSITTSVDVVIKVGDLISYLDKIYRVTDTPTSDSHILIVASLWEQQ